MLLLGVGSEMARGREGDGWAADQAAAGGHRDGGPGGDGGAVVSRRNSGALIKKYLGIIYIYLE